MISILHWSYSDILHTWNKQEQRFDRNTHALCVLFPAHFTSNDHNQAISRSEIEQVASTIEEHVSNFWTGNKNMAYRTAVSLHHRQYSYCTMLFTQAIEKNWSASLIYIFCHRIGCDVTNYNLGCLSKKS